MEVLDRVQELLKDYLAAKDMEIIDASFKREQGGMVLRLLVDHMDGGITIAECAAINNYLSEMLDNENVIDEHYTLEVSSPGLDRPVITDRDFERAMGKELEISLYEPIDDKRLHEGSLIGMDKDSIVIEADGISSVIPRAKIARARLKIRF